MTSWGASQLTGIELDEMTAEWPSGSIQTPSSDKWGIRTARPLTISTIWSSATGPLPGKAPSIAVTARYRRRCTITFSQGRRSGATGGLVISVTSAFTMDKKGKDSTRTGEKAELVAAFRLPTGALRTMQEPRW